MKTHRFVPLIVWIIIATMICIASLSLKLGSFRHPEPGMFPFIIGCVIILLSSMQLIIFLMHTKNMSEIFNSWPHSWRLKRSVIAVFLLLIFYAGTFSYLGFFLCTFLFFVALFKIMGRKTWGYIIFSSLTVSFLSYLLFQTLLKIYLPKGPFGI
jgi:hypothetical protein